MEKILESALAFKIVVERTVGRRVDDQEETWRLGWRRLGDCLLSKRGMLVQQLQRQEPLQQRSASKEIIKAHKLSVRSE